MERFRAEWIDVPVRVQHPAAVALKMAVGGLFVAPAVVIWAVCFGLAMLCLGGRRSARYAHSVMLNVFQHPPSLLGKRL
jgi:hypothetical protein